MKIAFVWHWQKKTLPELRGAYAARDTLFNAMRRLSEEGQDIKIFGVTTDPKVVGHFYSEDQGLHYVMRQTLPELMTDVTEFAPHVVFITHHSRPYDDLIDLVKKLPVAKGIYFSSPTGTASPKLRDFEIVLVHHEYQRQQLIGTGFDGARISIAPKTADLDLFRPDPSAEKRWDCIYPCRGGFHYWKRLELAVEACAIARLTLLAPASSLPGTLNRPAEHRFPWWSRRAPYRAYRWGQRWPRLNPFPWVTTIPWQYTPDMPRWFNQARCLVITSDHNEMGPRVIPEAAACNLPFVVCADNPGAVSHAERLGGFIARPDPEDIAAKLIEALSRPAETRQRMIEAGQDTWLIYRVLRQRLSEIAVPVG